MHLFRVYLSYEEILPIDNVYIYLLYTSEVNKTVLKGECFAVMSLVLSVFINVSDMSNEELLRYIPKRSRTILLEYMSPRQVYFTLCTLVIMLRYSGVDVNKILDTYVFTDTQLTWLFYNSGHTSDFDRHPKVLLALSKQKI